MLKNIAPKGTARSLRRARRLRREMSLPETLLWRALRGSQGGLKFRRQHPTGDYDLDFYCNDARLAIEVDGQAHERGDRPMRDAARDLWLQDKGIETLRIPAAELLKDVESAVRGVMAEAKARLPLHHPALSHSSPSLPRGGGPPEAVEGPLRQACGLPPPPGKLGEEF